MYRSCREQTLATQIVLTYVRKVLEEENEKGSVIIGRTSVSVVQLCSTVQYMHVQSVG